VLPRGSAVSGVSISPRAFLRNAAWGESEAAALGTAERKASVIKLAAMRNGLVILNGNVVFIVTFLHPVRLAEGNRSLT
jgi:hypothetical protein